MRKLFIGIAAVALLALLTLPVMAVEANPWSDCSDVQVEITIPEMAELWSSLGTGQERNDNLPAQVKVTNAGGIIPQEGIAEDTLTHCSNINVTVSVTLQDGIPPWTRFHVIVAPSNRESYNCVWALPEGYYGTHLIENVVADEVITWDRRSDAYSGNQLGAVIEAFTGSAGTASVAHQVDYAVDAIMGMPSVGSKTPTVIWTIAPSST